MRAVWTRARSDLRRHMRSAIVLAVLIGLTSALALAAAEGAQRTDTAYARLRAAVNAPDAIVVSGTGAAEALVPHVDFSKVALLPQVKAVHTVAYMIGEGVGADGKALFGGVTQGSRNILGAPTVEGQSAMPWKVLEGRLPDPTRSDEVAIGYMTQLRSAGGGGIDDRPATGEGERHGGRARRRGCRFPIPRRPCWGRRSPSRSWAGSSSSMATAS